jgi:hypothetical protein
LLSDIPVAFHKISILLHIDQDTIWSHWQHFQAEGLKDGENGILLIDQAGFCVPFSHQS